MAKKIACNGLEAAIADLTRAEEAPSNDWLTMREWSKVISREITATKVKIKKLVDAGTWETAIYSKKDASGRFQSVPHYRKKP